MAFRIGLRAALVAALLAASAQSAAAAPHAAGDDATLGELIGPANKLHPALYIRPDAPEYEYEGWLGGMVGEAFMTSDFAFLDKKANEYRVNKSRTPMGGWKLDHLYGTLNASGGDFPETDR